jgi:LAS superfamily LD-carboxypeptidase LdcB
MVPLLILAAAATACAAPAPPGALAANATSLTTLAWAPFGRPETGWAVYAPKVAAEIGTPCAVATPGFAAALGGWQGGHRLAPTGVFDALTFAAMKAKWQNARPFVHIDGKTACPPPPTDLATASPKESYGGKTIQLRAGALAAFRAMRAAALLDPALHAEPRSLTIFSGFRDPAADAARCTAEGNCNGIVRATCSAHRTGLAMDLWVGNAPGFGPDSSADANRAAMTAGPQYRWLLANAARFGFVNYVFEPWHWEWTGEPI